MRQKPKRTVSIVEQTRWAISDFCEKYNVMTGSKAAIAVNFPHTFSAIVAKYVADKNIAIALRVGTPPDIEGDPRASKTIDYKTNVSPLFYPVVHGVIPKDQVIFGRPESKALPRDTEYVQLYREVADLIIGADEIKEEGDKIVFSARWQDKDKNRKAAFCLDLSRSKVLGDEAPSASELRPWTEDKNEQAKQFLEKIKNQELKNKLQALLHQSQKFLYAVEYRADKKLPFSSLEVAAINGKPITGDIDILYIAMNDANREKIFRTTRSESLETLTDKVGKHIPTQTSSFIDESKKYGMITEAGAILVREINQEFAKKYPHFYGLNLLQHGPETYNPGKASEFGPTLHFFLGWQILTKNEEELVALVLTPNYLENFTFLIHPDWNMHYWAEVVKKQLSLGHLVKPETLKAYDVYRIQHENVGLRNRFFKNTPATISSTYRDAEEKPSTPLNPTKLKHD